MARSVPASAADFLTASYDYPLPPDHIAQTPACPRDQARLLVIQSQGHHHSHFYNLPEWLQPGDLLVLNDTRVIPARLYGHKVTGAQIEILLLEPQTQDPTQLSSTWLCLVKPGRRVRVGDQLQFAQGLTAQVLASDPETGGRILAFSWPDGIPFERVLEQVGEMPLPPYITSRESTASDYQTIWAKTAGSVAAPTAGLHFTPELLQALQTKGIETAFVTLRVGLGTFRPVETEEILAHQLHREWLQVPAATVEAIQQTRQRGGRVIGVGTTVARALESAAQQGSQPQQKEGKLQAWQGYSTLFIYPGYEWQVLDGLITNFHLPRSSLMMMISALTGRERLLSLYAEAIAQDYRFYSFGDGMFILPN
ncbi:MAG: tRNA preQ1(34) S-adenosylmethionine ribosyltransferase-isomerase QueA [Cyanophyceae cyanobacterium]